MEPDENEEIQIHANERIAALVNSVRSSLAYSGPESADLHWHRLREELEDIVHDALEARADLQTPGGGS